MSSILSTAGGGSPSRIGCVQGCSGAHHRKHNTASRIGVTTAAATARAIEITPEAVGLAGFVRKVTPDEG